MTDGGVLRVVPRRDLLRTATITFLATCLPLSVLLYWYAVPRGQGAVVLVAQVIAVAAFLAVGARQLTVHTEVTATELRGSGIFSPLERVPLERIASVDLVATFVGSGAEKVTQLLVRDAAGRRLFRMRGNFWTPGALERVAAALPVAARVAREPVSMREFFTAYPGSAYWFENRPWVVGLLIAAGAAAGVWVLVTVMHALGMPIMA